MCTSVCSISLMTRYGVQGEMECCKTDLCNTLEMSPVSASSNSTYLGTNHVSGCLKKFRLNGTESLVPSHFIAMNDDLNNPMQPGPVQVRRRRRASNTQIGGAEAEAGAGGGERGGGGGGTGSGEGAGAGGGRGTGEGGDGRVKRDIIQAFNTSNQSQVGLKIINKLID